MVRNHSILKTDFGMLRQLANSDIENLKKSRLMFVNSAHLTELFKDRFKNLESVCRYYSYDIFLAKEKEQRISVKSLSEVVRAALYAVQAKAEGVDNADRNDVESKLQGLVSDDVNCLIRAAEFYGQSWQKRGGVGAFMMLARKYDRIVNQLGDHKDLVIYVSHHVEDYPEGILDDVIDLRRYLLLVGSYFFQCEVIGSGKQGFVETDDYEPSSGYVAQD